MNSEQFANVMCIVKMKRNAAVFVIFVILLSVISGSALSREGLWKKSMFREQFAFIFDQNETKFVWRIELREKYCDYERLTTNAWGSTIDLKNVLDAKPDGYKLKLEYTSIKLKHSGVALSSGTTANNFDTFYRIGIIDFLPAPSAINGSNYLANSHFNHRF